MKILLANKYFFLKGGAEHSFFQTAKLLEKKGHDVVFFSMKHPQNFPSEFDKYFVKYIDFDDYSLKNIMRASGRILYSFDAKRKTENLILNERPDIAHINNVYHQISPSFLQTLRKMGIPIVLTLRDYKLVCASYAMLINNEPCEACKDGKYYQCLLKGCMKNSYLKSLLSSLEMYLHHKILHIYDMVDVFISPSLFLKNKLKEMGFKREIIHLPNFVPLEEFHPQYEWKERSIIYFGRLSIEKGLFTLLEAVKGLKGIDLKIVGEGPMKDSLEATVSSWKEEQRNVRFLGFKTGDELINEIQKSMFVVLPSESYENNPRNIIEGFALGKPALASRIGGIPELVRDNVTGFTFEARNANDLRSKLIKMLENTQEIPRMGKNGRMLVEHELHHESHYEKLMEIYESTLEMKRHRVKIGVYDVLTENADFKIRFEDFGYRIFWFFGIMLSFLLYYTGIVWVYTFFRKKVLKKFNTTILMYHRVRDDKIATNISVSTKNFEKQMEFLKASFKVVSMENLVKNIKSKTKSTKDAIAITFDDGYKDNYWNAFPILKKNRFPATVFLVYELINNDRNMLNIEEIKLMKKNRIDFGSHTISHKVLRNVDSDTAAAEIFQSKEELSVLLKENIIFFSYPRGKRRHFTPIAKNLVKQAGYKAAFTTENGTISKRSDFFELNRIGIRDFPLYVFKTRVSGLFESALFLPIRKFMRLT